MNREIYLLTNGSPNKDWFVPVQINDGSIEAQKISIESFLNSGSGVSLLQKKITLSSSDILNLFSTPVTIVDTPPSGYLIRPISAIFSLNYNSAQYSGGNMVVSHSGSGSSQFTNTVYASNSSVMGIYTPTSGSLPLSALNAPLVVSIASADPTTGDSTMDIFITYYLIQINE